MAVTWLEKDLGCEVHSGQRRIDGLNSRTREVMVFRVFMVPRR